MYALLKALIIPLVFILPIVWIRLSGLNSTELNLPSQPLFLALLFPGLIIIAERFKKAIWG